ncbi:hypothetical protein [Methylobacter svalbardensis]|uniref:hypothetical protein n=1 Tax=Methylobacter svalbardensis TaxID=3080016 RepID=UPI0030EF8BEE
MQEYAGIARRKCSEGKATWPGRKQAYRSYDSGAMSGDTVNVDNAPYAGQPLLQLVMQGGKTVAGQPMLVEAREYA